MTAALPHYCPTAEDVRCCPEHVGTAPCCDLPHLHRPLDPPADGGCLFSEMAARILAGAGERRSTHPQPDDLDRLRARAETLRVS